MSTSLSGRTGESRTVPRPALRRSPFRGYRLAIVLADSLAITLALLVASRVRGLDSASLLSSGWDRSHHTPYQQVSLLIAAGWLVCLVLSNSYARRHMGSGSDEFKAVTRASMAAAAVVAFGCYLTQSELSRIYFGLVFLLGPPFLLVGRYTSRQVLHWRRTRGRNTFAAIVVGGVAEVTELIGVLRREAWAGYRVVGVCLPDDFGEPELCGVPVVGSPETIRRALNQTGADSVLVTGGAGAAGRDFQRIAWQLEGAGADLAVVPSFNEVAGPRIHVRPIAGLPLLHLQLPEFTGPQRMLKRFLDMASAAIALFLISPLLVLIALGVKLTSPGPVLFRQVRIGRHGDEFECLKFRTMVVNAEARLAELAPQSDGNELLFKLRVDPRVTPLGRRLRRFSLDELPQLVNIVRGEMSVVGPRPPLPQEVRRYSADLRRRLLVRPGLTGLWQVSGRSDLSLDESTRLDLYYIDNWSLMHDIEIVWKTLRAVLTGRGAY